MRGREREREGGRERERERERERGEARGREEERKGGREERLFCFVLSCAVLVSFVSYDKNVCLLLLELLQSLSCFGRVDCWY